MTRCCFPGCDSGTVAEINRTRDAGLRAISKYSFPQVSKLWFYLCISSFMKSVRGITTLLQNIHVFKKLTIC